MDKISICCLCYNHSEYLEKALESFLFQKGEFEMEIVIFDDCSTDNSREIINKYKEKYPAIIEVIYPEKNVYSQGKIALFDIVNMATGKYLAFCEGDDYWIDDEKLSKQVQYLKNNTDLELVFHPALTLYEPAVIKDENYGYYGEQDGKHSFRDILAVSGSYMPMASIFAKKSAFTNWLNEYPEFFSRNMWHSTIQILAAYKGGAGYLPEKMSIYRKMHVGSWSHNMSRSSNAVETDFKGFIDRNRGLNKIFKSEFEEIFNRLLLSKIINVAMLKHLKFSTKIKLKNLVPIKIPYFITIKFYALCLIFFVAKYVKK